MWRSCVAVKVRPLACSHVSQLPSTGADRRKCCHPCWAQKLTAVGVRVFFIRSLAWKQSLSQRMIFFPNRGCNAATRLLCSPLRVGREIALVVERCVAINNRIPHGLLQFYLIRFILQGTFSYLWPRFKPTPFSFLVSAPILFVLKLIHVMLTPHGQQFNSSLTQWIRITGFNFCQMHCLAHSPSAKWTMEGVWASTSAQQEICLWEEICVSLWSRVLCTEVCFG